MTVSHLATWATFAPRAGMVASCGLSLWLVDLVAGVWTGGQGMTWSLGPTQPGSSWSSRGAAPGLNRVIWRVWWAGVVALVAWLRRLVRS